MDDFKVFITLNYSWMYFQQYFPFLLILIYKKFFILFDLETKPFMINGHFKYILFINILKMSRIACTDLHLKT